MEGADVEPVPALLQEVVRDVLAVVLAAVVAVADLLGEVADVAPDAGGGLWDFFNFIFNHLHTPNSMFSSPGTRGGGRGPTELKQSSFYPIGKRDKSVYSKD